MTNVLEFCGVPGYFVDYYSQFDLPSSPSDRNRGFVAAHQHWVMSTDSDSHLPAGNEELNDAQHTAPVKEEEVEEESRENNLRRRPPCNDTVDVMEIA